MHLIAGLGNPGDEHSGQRHSIGFMAADRIVEAHSIGPFKNKFSGLIADGTVDGERVLVLKPQTYMNRSGNSVAAAMKFYKIPLSNVTVIFDELDLAPGKVRVKTGGGNGGHNGLRSIEAATGNAFHRVRLGIGHPGHKALVHNHVLGNFAKSDAEWLDPLLDAMARNAGLLVKGDHANFMNRMALAVQTPVEPAPIKANTPKKQSHIRQARPKAGKAGEAKMPQSGPMAAMLRRILGKDKG